MLIGRAEEKYSKPRRQNLEDVKLYNDELLHLTLDGK